MTDRQTTARFDTEHISYLRLRLWRAEAEARELRQQLSQAETERTKQLLAEIDPAKRFPCGRTHACASCSPNRIERGPGCHNCRQTGYDQSPCLPCGEAVRVGPPAARED